MGDKAKVEYMIAEAIEAHENRWHTSVVSTHLNLTRDEADVIATACLKFFFSPKNEIFGSEHHRALREHLIKYLNNPEVWEIKNDGKKRRSR